MGKEPWLQSCVLNYLRTCGDWRSTKQIVEWVYDGRRDGGALCATACVQWAIRELRRRGFPIEQNGVGKGVLGYRYRWSEWELPSGGKGLHAGEAEG